MGEKLSGGGGNEPMGRRSQWGISYDAGNEPMGRESQWGISYQVAGNEPMGEKPKLRIFILVGHGGGRHGGKRHGLWKSLGE